jgi:hypothetical protein
MADFRHPNCPLIRGCLPRHQLIFEVNFDHFAHQAIGSAAHGGDLLQYGKAGIARFQRTFKGINLAPNATDARENAFFIFG